MKSSPVIPQAEEGTVMFPTVTTQNRKAGDNSAHLTEGSPPHSDILPLPSHLALKAMQYFAGVTGLQTVTAGNTQEVRLPLSDGHPTRTFTNF